MKTMAKIGCFLCNKDISTGTIYSLFSQAAGVPKAYPSLCEILEIMLNLKLHQNTVHTPFVCDNCKSLLYFYHRLELNYVSMRTQIIAQYHKSFEEHIAETQSQILDNLAIIDCLTTGDEMIRSPKQLYINDNFEIQIEDNSIVLDHDDSMNSSPTENQITNEDYKQFERRFLCNDVNFDHSTSRFLNENDSDYKILIDDNLGVIDFADVPDNYDNIMCDASQHIKFSIDDVEQQQTVLSLSSAESTVGDNLKIIPKSLYNCDWCESIFDNGKDLSRHKLKVHQKSGFKCEQCDSHFSRKRQLDCHYRAAHTGERPFECATCKICFGYPHNYERHLQIHYDVKPYACEICGKTFTDRSNRNAHRFVHSDKKQYECFDCGSGFMRKIQLFAHMQAMRHTSTFVINQPPEIYLSASASN